MSYGLLDLTKDVLKGNFHSVSKQTADARIAMCNACPDLTKIRTCKHCGCFMDVKVQVPQSECPIGKWKAVG